MKFSRRSFIGALFAVPFVPPVRLILPEPLFVNPVPSSWDRTSFPSPDIMLVGDKTYKLLENIWKEIEDNADLISAYNTEKLANLIAGEKNAKG